MVTLNMKKKTQKNPPFIPLISFLVIQLFGSLFDLRLILKLGKFLRERGYTFQFCRKLIGPLLLDLFFAHWKHYIIYGKNQ